MSPESPPDGQPECIDVLSNYVFLSGETFSSYEQLENRLKKHSEQDFVYYWRRDTRTIKGALTKTSRPLAARLKYYSIRYACVHGGQKFAKRGHGQRTKQTMRSNCPAFITLRAAKCGQKLEVIDVCNQHNHPISEQDSRSLPQNRRLPPDIRDEVLEMLRVHIDRKKIFEYIRCKTGKQLNNKNLLNMRTIYKHSMNTLLENVASEKKRLLQKIQLVCGTQPNGKNMNIMESYDDFDDELFEIPEENIIDIDDIIEKEDDGFSQVIEEIVVDDNESYEHCQVYSIEMGDPFNSDANDSNDMLSVDPHKTENNDDPSATDPIEDIPPIDNRYDGYDFSEYYEYQPSSPKNDLLNNDPILDTPKESLINQPLSTKSTNTANFTRLRKTKTNKTRNRNCRHCGLNARLVRMQIAVLEAEKEKLVEETQILRLTKERLLMETAISGNVDDDDGALVEIVNEVEENQFEC